jgi:4a-hydroxytetrahydrobiopterin dehydratase
VTTLLDETLIADTLASLPGWEGDSTRLWREVHLAPEVDAELRRQVAVDAQSMGHAPAVETIEGGTRFVLTTHDAGGVTELDVTLASHISDLVHRLSSSEPGVNAVREGAPVVVTRPGEGGQGDEAEKDTSVPFGQGSISGGTLPLPAPAGPGYPMHPTGDIAPRP